MKFKLLKKYLAAACVAAVVAPCSSYAASVMIDNFNNGTIQSITSTPPPAIPNPAYAANAALPLTETLFGARHTMTYAFANTVPTFNVTLDVNRAGTGTFNHSTDTNAAGRTVLFLDGTTTLNSSLNPNASSVDLTDGGKNNIIKMHIESTDISPSITMIFRDSDGISFSLNTPSGVVPTFADDFDLIIPMASWTGVDFTEINGFQMLIDNPIKSMGPPRTYYYNMDTIVDYIEATTTVPEPSTMVLLGAGLVGAFAMRRRVKK